MGLLSASKGRYGDWGKHIEMFEVFDAFRKNPRVLEELFGGSDAYKSALQEGSGAPEARVDFPIFLQTVVHHRIRDRFKTASSEWEKFVGIESAQDFREHTVSSLGAIRGFKPVGEAEPYPRLRSSEEEGPPFSVGKWGGIYALTMELVINDEMDRLLNRIPGELGEAASEYITELVIAFIESNPTYIDGLPFFHASRQNNVTGASADPTEDNLMAQIDVMKLRRNSENKPITIVPRRILVRNPSLKAKFDAMIRSQTTGVRSEVTAVGAPEFAPGTDNAVANVLPPDAVVQDSWLNAPNDFYLMADAQKRPPFVVAFLRGQRTPQMFLQDSGMRGVGGGGADPYSMEFDEIPYKLRHFTGVASGEPLAATRFQP